MIINEGENKYDLALARAAFIHSSHFAVLCLASFTITQMQKALFGRHGHRCENVRCRVCICVITL